MSIKIMAMIWDNPNPKSVAERLVLLALADQANESGYCWPSLNYLAKKCSISQRYLQNILNKLEGEFIDRDRRYKMSTMYRIRVENYSSLENRGSPTREQGFPSLENHTSPEPSLTIINHHDSTAQNAVENDKPKPKRVRKSTKDDRTSSPAIQAIFMITGRYPAKDQYDVLIKILGDNPDTNKMQKCWQAWRAEKPGKKPYSPFNYGWLTDWYRNGIPGEKEPIFNDDDPFYYMKKVMSDGNKRTSSKI